MHQNVTLRLESRLIRRAKVVAAQQGTSISGLLTRHLERMLEAEEAYEAAQKRALRLLHRGFHLGGTMVVSRDELHER